MHVVVQLNPVRDDIFIATARNKKSESRSDGIEIGLKPGFGGAAYHALKSVINDGQITSVQMGNGSHLK